MARSSVPFAFSGGSDELVAMGGLSEAMERLRLVSGSADGVAMNTGP